MAAATPIPVPTVDPALVLARPGIAVVDLRSPAEYAEDHLPGAVNVPLFDDVERAVIGTLYKKSSPEAAFREGLERTTSKVAALVERIGEVVGWRPPEVDVAARVRELAAGGIGALEGKLDAEPVTELAPDAAALHCWRGGLRSRSVVALLRTLGLERAVAIDGGYRAYRREVRRELEEWVAPATFVLRGLTGVGKTLVLRAVEELRPGWTVDLEGIAGHRSSILGMVGREPVTQKAFDSGLAKRLRDELAPGDRIVFEGESRKVGDVILPARVWEAMCAGHGIELAASTERRVAVLIEDYLATEGSRDELARRLPFIEERLGRTKWNGVLVAMLEGGREQELVALLLERYYDPLYRHSEAKRTLHVRIDAEDEQRAAQEVIAWIEERCRD